MVSHVGRVAILTLNSPLKLNALSVSMGEEFQRAVRALKETEPRCVVVTGAGAAFSAGGDLEFLRQRLITSPEENAAEMRAYYARCVCLCTLRLRVLSVQHRE